MGRRKLEEGVKRVARTYRIKPDYESRIKSLIANQASVSMPARLAVQSDAAFIDYAIGQALDELEGFVTNKTAEATNE